MHIKLVSAQVAQLRILYRDKSEALYLLEGPDSGHTTEGKKEKEKAQLPAGIEPTTSRVMLPRHVLYHCATSADRLLDLEKSRSQMVVRNCSSCSFEDRNVFNETGSRGRGDS